MKLVIPKLKSSSSGYYKQSQSGIRSRGWEVTKEQLLHLLISRVTIMWKVDYVSQKATNTGTKAK